jgi:uncharacterized protein YecT (DUF1311 family)
MKRMRVCVVALLAVSIHALHAQDPAPTSADKLTAASIRVDQAERELGDAYNKLLVALNEPGRKRLERAQQAWAEYRDAQAAFYCLHVMGEPQERVEYYTQLRLETEKRTKELRNAHEWMRQVQLKKNASR